MPTGFTIAVQDGTITDLPQFALKCARAFGALIDMRDEPNDAPIPESLSAHTDYHDRALVDARSRLDDLAKMSPEDCDKAAEGAYVESLTHWKRRVEERALQLSRYEAMLAQVGEWSPPAEIASLKAFMLEQLQESIKYDCSSTYDESPPQRQSASEWLKDSNERALQSITYHEEELAEEIKRTEERNRWLTALRASLKSIQTKGTTQ